ncbi:MAG: hypothetical protein HYV07_23240, partial [Deltaproteobacteria bacterium]|nr:hypothetical protein [Deltaproteobacteria bacterium]
MTARGTAIEPMEAGPKLPLIAVHGVDPTGVYAAGGGATGALLRYDGAVWHD